ncbi:MAG TPA: NB-ARC domain-containing protein [Chloroflexaceae bacterium]|nr:NB-ARC domain-containing protein [Chloroflexaceae bacterium]
MQQKRNETFGRLLKAGVASITNCEGRTALVVEEELGDKIGVVGSTIQRYKSGFVPPESRTIEILAEACVRRGMLGREWLEQFLLSARYPRVEQLLEELRPITSSRPRPPRVYANLPSPTYSQFVVRERAFADVIDGLHQRSAVILVVGLGGNGKTSLAREVAAACLRDDGAAPRFDAVVWISDKDRPGTTNLSTVFNTIARTLDFPGIVQLAYDEKQHEVEQLLRSQRVLLIVDNFETITDDGLLVWLLRLPEPSKAIVTSREYRREWRSSWPVELRGMNEAEVWALITERAHALKIERLVEAPQLIEPLIAATGGNPKAVTITMGLVKYERRPLPQVLDDLYTARGELFDDLFTRAWALLDEAARRVLRTMPLFPDRAHPTLLAAAADVKGFAFDRAVERLNDLALIDMQQQDLTTAPRYTLHPLVRAFVVAKLADEPAFEAEAWGRWARSLEEQVTAAIARQPYSDLNLLEESDLTARACLDWAYRTERWELFNTVHHRIASLWSIRGLFDVRQAYGVRAVEVCARAGNVRRQIRSLANLARLATYLGNIMTALQYLEKARQLWHKEHSGPTLPDDSTSAVLLSTEVTLLLEQSRPQEALALLEHHHPLSSDEWGENRRQYMIGLTLYRLGRTHEARTILTQVLEDAEHIGSARQAGNTANYLVDICLTEGDFEAAHTYLSRSQAISAHVRDRRHYASLQVILARFHRLQGNIPAARDALIEAIDVFERLGNQRALAEGREALATLDG